MFMLELIYPLSWICSNQKWSQWIHIRPSPLSQGIVSGKRWIYDGKGKYAFAFGRQPLMLSIFRQPLLLSILNSGA